MRIKIIFERRLQTFILAAILAAVAASVFSSVVARLAVSARGDVAPGVRGRAVVSQKSIEDVAMVALPAPDFKRAAEPRRRARGARLVVLSSKPNEITDTEKWFKDNRLALPMYDVTGEASNSDESASAPLPSNVPRTYKGNLLTRAIAQSGSTLLVYGENYGEGRYLVSMNPVSGVFRYGFDFVNYAYPPGMPRARRDFTYQNIDWAIEEGDTLYVAHSHATYARTSGGMNAYITAINFRNGRVLWRSPPLVSNASNFDITGDLIVSGYGFTNEPDFLYLLDKRSGRELHRLPIKTGPTYIIRRGERIYVRAYNADLVVGVATGARR